MVAFTYGPHAADMLMERNLDPFWVEQAVLAPDSVEPDPKHAARIRAFRAIPERDGRVLRVVYEQTGETVRIITVFLDRGRRRRG